MTAIVGIQGKGWAVLGADTTTSYLDRPYVAKGCDKIVKIGEYLIAVAGDAIVGDILNNLWQPPKVIKTQDPDRFMMIRVLPSIKQALNEAGNDPAPKGKSDDELKHIAVTIYYTITIGVLMKVVKILLYKKGLSGDGAALGAIRDMITSGLKFGSYGLDFDDIEKESDVIFSNKSFAPVAQQIIAIGGVYGKIFEVNENKIRYRDFYDV